MRRPRLPASCAIPAAVAGLLIQLAASVPAPGAGPADRYATRIWQAADGLPESSVAALAQTPDGYLWIGTRSGLARFDGVRFVFFEPANARGLTGAQVGGLLAEPGGRLWVSIGDGPSAIFENGRLRALPPARDWPGGVPGSVQAAPGGGLLVTSSRHQLIRVLDDRCVQVFPGTTNLLTAAVDATGTIWALDQLGLRFWKSNRWEGILPAPDFSRASRGGLAAARQGGVWATSSNVLWRATHEGVVERRDARPWQRAVTLLEDSAGQVWVGTRNEGLFRQRPDGLAERVPLRTDGSVDSVVALLEDHDGAVWAGTGRGLVRLTPPIFVTHEWPAGPDGNLAAPLAVDSAGRVVVAGPNEGLWEVSDSGLLSRTPLDSGRDPMSGLRLARDGTLWSVSPYSVASRKGARFRRYGEEQGVPRERFESVFEDQSGRVWIGGGPGIYAFTGTTFQPARDMPASDVRAIAEDPAGNVWFGANDGLIRRTADGTVTFFTATNAAGAHHVRVLLADGTNALWIGTASGGLHARVDGKFHHLSGPGGLPANDIRCIIDDQLGFLWIGGSSALFRVARTELLALARGGRRELEHVRYGPTVGLSSAEFARGHPSAIRGNDGRLYFSTMRGVTVVDPRRIPTQRPAAPVAIEDVLIDDAVVYSNHDPRAGHQPAGGTVLRVAPGWRRMVIRFTQIHPAALTVPRFRHRLDGYDREWSATGAERTAVFNGLPPGNYVFRVTGAGPTGVWGVGEATLALRVLPAWWQTWWFRGGSAALLLAGGASIYLLRVRQLQRVHSAQESFSRQLLQRQEAERQRIAGELHDSLGQNLLLIKNHALLALRGRELDPGVRDSLDAISSVSSGSIDEVRAIAGNLRPHHLDRLGLRRAIEAMIRMTSQSSGLEIISDLDETQGLLTKETEINLFRVVQECFNNILKHAGARRVEMVLRCEPGFLRLRISDDGRGFDPYAAPFGRGENQGFGLAGMTERIRISGGRLQFHSAPDQGTTIVAEIPLPPPGEGHP